VVQRTDAGTELIRLAWPDVGAAEAEAVAEVLESGQLTMGPKVEEFERGLAALSTGCGRHLWTAALHLAAALWIRPPERGSFAETYPRPRASRSSAQPAQSTHEM
jgi:hypothetical protein